MHFTHSSEREALIIMMNTSSIVDATTNTNSISCLEAEGLPCYGNIWLYVTVPIFAAIIGWGTNVVALFLTFWPLEFTGVPIKRYLCGDKQPIGCIGWQGIIPTKAPDMARKCIELMTRELFSLQEVFARVDPETIADIMKPQLVPVIHKLMDDVGHKFLGKLWTLQPQSLQQIFVNGAIDACPEMIIGLMNEVGEDIEAVLDVENAVVTMLNERKELLNNVFKQCGDKEFTFIERSGAYLGFLFGVLQTILWYFYKGMWVLPAAGFIVGIATNYIALYIIFNPTNPVNICCCTIQGIFLTRQPKVSRVFAKIMADEVVTPHLLWRFILQADRKEGVKRTKESKKFYAILRHHVRKMSKKMIGSFSPIIGLSLDPKEVENMHKYIEKEIEKQLPKLTPCTYEYMKEALNFEYTLRTAMQSLPPKKFEDVLHPVFQEDEAKLVFVGGVLGAAAGAIQLFTVFA